MQLELFVSNNYLNEHNSPYYECKECKQTLHESKFRVRADRSDYRNKECKDCSYVINKITTDLKAINKVPMPDKCDCCHKLMKPEEFYFDHCHVEHVFRGWLCNTCNSGIGVLGDTLPHLERAVEYLKAHNERRRLSQEANKNTQKDNLQGRSL
jgi:hypothetical protein